MNAAPTWPEYVATISENALEKDIAARAGLSPSTVSRWKSGAKLTAEQAIAIARGYDANPVHALVVAGFLTEDEAVSFAPPLAFALREVDELSLAREIVRRVESGAGGLLEAPVDELPANVTALRKDKQPTITEDEAIELGAVAKEAVIDVDGDDDTRDDGV